METPVYLCGTHAVGTVYQAAITASGRGPEHVMIPVVGECDDGDMADSRTVTAADVERALEALGPEVAEGTVGAGTGMMCYGYPGGIGTASRVVGESHGRRAAAVQLRRPRVPRPARSRPRPAPDARPGREGSCIAVCVTDAPLAPHQLRRLALRPLLGLARTGSYAHEGSGEIGLALLDLAHRRASTTRRSTRISPARTRPRRRRSTTASSPGAQPSASTARCRRSFRSISSAAPGREPVLGIALAFLDGVVRALRDDRADADGALRDEVVELARG